MFYVLLTVHLGVILVNDQLDAQFFFSYMFIPNLYMFWALMCSSSGELVVSIRHLVYVTSSTKTRLPQHGLSTWRRYFFSLPPCPLRPATTAWDSSALGCLPQQWAIPPGAKMRGSVSTPQFRAQKWAKAPEFKNGGKSPWLKVKMGPDLENVGLYMCKWSKCNGRHRECLTLDM